MDRRTFLSATAVTPFSLAGCLTPGTIDASSIPVQLDDAGWHRSADNPHITGTDQTLQQAGFGGVINTEGVLKNPIDSWYFYWSGHDGGGIWLSTAPALEGPWTRQQMLFDAGKVGGGDHVSSPYPIVHPSGEVWL